MAPSARHAAFLTRQRHVHVSRCCFAGLAKLLRQLAERRAGLVGGVYRLAVNVQRVLSAEQVGNRGRRSGAGMAAERVQGALHHAPVVVCQGRQKISLIAGAAGLSRRPQPFDVP